MKIPDPQIHEIIQWGNTRTILYVSCFLFENFRGKNIVFFFSPWFWKGSRFRAPSAEKDLDVCKPTLRKWICGVGVLQR